MSGNETLERTESGVILPSGIAMEEADRELAELDAIERIQWGDEQFGGSLYSMTSGGTQSAVLPRLIAKADLKTPEVLVNTGNLFAESIRYARQIARLNGLPLLVTTSLLGELSDEQARSFYDADPDEYAEVTKLEPMRRIISERGIKAVLSAVRAGQTENRAGLNYIGQGRDGEFRIHPIIDWSEDKVIRFIRQEGQPDHPMTARGFGSVGDRITTAPGTGREGRDLGEHNECGLHLPGRAGQAALQTS